MSKKFFFLLCLFLSLILSGNVWSARLTAVSPELFGVDLLATAEPGVPTDDAQDIADGFVYIEGDNIPEPDTLPPDLTNQVILTIGYSIYIDLNGESAAGGARLSVSSSMGGDEDEILLATGGVDVDTTGELELTIPIDLTVAPYDLYIPIHLIAAVSAKTDFPDETALGDYAIARLDWEFLRGEFSIVDDTDNPDNGTSVPEPATMLLLGTGLIGLAGLRRRFKK